MGVEKDRLEGSKLQSDVAADAPAKSETQDDIGVRIVGVGASAGGLDPIEKFFDSMPVDAGVAYVIVQHLSPDFRSMMDQLIARHSTMTIRHAEDGMPFEENVVYLNPPRTELTISEGKLRTREYTDPETLGLPIDSFFRSLAEHQGEKAIGIIMSGTGSDGTRGGIAICEAGGAMIVQDPQSASFDSMPRSAIERGAATAVAIPAEMPKLVSQLILGEDIGPKKNQVNDGDDPEQVILAMLERRYGADFGYYKQSTVGRRIRRRGLLNQIHSLRQYIDFLEQDPSELEALYFDLLIGVTSFFRDAEAFEALAELALPSLVPTMSEKRQLRVWAPGCASGEEAYSLAILISEFVKERDLALNLKIFATDIHPNSLDIASSGIYDREGLNGVPAHLIDEYFDTFDDRYRVKKKLRKLVVFSPHNLIKDPPFTRMDLVTCRNLLIYFDDIAQQKVLALFHFALRKDGILFLGPSESTGSIANEFEVLDKRWRLYRKTRDVRLRASSKLLPLSDGAVLEPREVHQLRETRTSSATLSNSGLERKMLMQAYDKVLEEVAPTSLLIDGEGELVHLFGNAGSFLSLSRGQFSKRVSDLLVPELKFVVSAGIERARAHRSSAFRRNTKVTRPDGTEMTVVVGIKRLDVPGEKANYLLITLEEKDDPTPAAAPLSDGAEIDSEFFSQRIGDLERDLKVTEESLQTSIEELETSNEELQATNEELMASNEELQSTNEELHSVNEELYTVSAEHQQKIEELTQLTDDMDNFLRATNIGTIFLDPNLNVRRFTPATDRTFNFVPHDVGRPFQHITYRFDYDGLIDDVEAVRDTGTTINREISVDRNAHLLNILPYQSEQEDLAGVVLTIVDIQDLKAARQELAEEQKLYRDVVENQSEKIVRFKPDLTITFVNDAFCRFHAVTAQDAIGQNHLAFLPEDAHESFKASIERLEPKIPMEIEGYRRSDESQSNRWIHAVLTGKFDASGQLTEVQSVGRDVTALRQAQEKLVALNVKLRDEQNRFKRLYQKTPAMMHSIDEDGIIVEASEYWLDVMGYEPEEVIGRESTEFLTEASRQYATSEVLPKLWQDGFCSDVPYQMVKKDGSTIDVLLSAILTQGEDGKRGSSLAVVTDVTKQLRAEQALATSLEDLTKERARLDQIYRSTPVMLHSILEDGEIIEVSDYWCDTMGYDPSDVIGQSIYDFMDPESVERMAQINMIKLFGHNQPIEHEPYTYIRKDGQPLPVILSAITGPRRNGEGLQTFSVVFDITEQKEAQRVLAERNDELARINENLNQFAHIVSHDLTGPLRAIEHTTNWIEQDAVPDMREDIQDHINRLKDQVTHLSGLLSDLLNYSRAGSGDEAEEIVDLPHALKLIFDVIEKPDGMTLEISQMPETIRTLRAPLLLVFRNLIENAIKYHDSETGRITVRSEEDDDEWSFMVEDDGPGIDAKFHQKIFLPFRKLESKGTAPGNGIGLALVRKAVEINGGKMSIESDPANKPGTRFIFTWPKNRASALAAE